MLSILSNAEYLIRNIKLNIKCFIKLVRIWGPLLKPHWGFFNRRSRCQWCQCFIKPLELNIPHFYLVEFPSQFQNSFLVMLIKILLMVLLVEAKVEWRFHIKRGGQEPWRPYQNNQLLERIYQRKQQYGQITMVQKMKNVKLRNLLSKITGKNRAQKNQHNKAEYRMNRLRKFHKNWSTLSLLKLNENLCVVLESFSAK